MRRRRRLRRGAGLMDEADDVDCVDGDEEVEGDVDDEDLRMDDCDEDSVNGNDAKGPDGVGGSGTFTGSSISSSNSIAASASFSDTAGGGWWRRLLLFVLLEGRVRVLRGPCKNAWALLLPRGIDVLPELEFVFEPDGDAEEDDDDSDDDDGWDALRIRMSGIDNESDVEVADEDDEASLRYAS
ncbi:hypothetical protein DL93DRAFT_2097904 [Clavulina sp. PMI_390]|nr:hypothetical protein DL93DRAFT_2097904 [Clavulina sp. PMI_390]